MEKREFLDFTKEELVPGTLTGMFFHDEIEKVVDLPKAPAKDIRYGMLQPDCERKYKAWVVTLIEEAIKDPTKRIDIAHEIYEEILQLGYDYGADSAAEDRAWGED